MRVLCGVVVVIVLHGAESIDIICSVPPCTHEWLPASAGSEEEPNQSVTWLVINRLNAQTQPRSRLTLQSGRPVRPTLSSRKRILGSAEE